MPIKLNPGFSHPLFPVFSRFGLIFGILFTVISLSAGLITTFIATPNGAATAATSTKGILVSLSVYMVMVGGLVYRMVWTWKKKISWIYDLILFGVIPVLIFLSGAILPNLLRLLLLVVVAAIANYQALIAQHQCRQTQKGG